MEPADPSSLEEAARLLGAASNPTALAPRAFEPLPASDSDRLAAAVDGGHTVVADLGASGVVGVRAGFTLRGRRDEFHDHVTYDSVHVVHRRHAEDEWRRWTRPYDAGAESPVPLLSGLQWIHAWCDAERGLAEYDAARKALRLLAPGDLLLWDGSLEAEASSNARFPRLIETARAQGVRVAGIAKDTSVTFGGTLPFTIELEDAAATRGAPGRFYVDVSDLVGSEAFRTFGVRLDPRSPVYRVDVAAGDPPVPVLAALHALANDVAFPGYPYPLARIHHRVHFGADEAGELRRRLEAAIAEHQGHALGRRLLGRGRDVLALGG